MTVIWFHASLAPSLCAQANDLGLTYYQMRISGHCTVAPRALLDAIQCAQQAIPPADDLIRAGFLKVAQYTSAQISGSFPSDLVRPTSAVAMLLNEGIEYDDPKWALGGTSM